jgi:tetratricopeptide (TPR) repeat protein
MWPLSLWTTEKKRLSTGQHLRSWSELDQYLVDFSSVEGASSILDERRGLLAITGPPGAGKTTFLLWALARALDTKQTWLKQVVFLSPAILKSNSEEWKQHLLEMDPTRTLIAVDSLFRIEDSDEQRQQKVNTLEDLRTFQQYGERKLSPFEVVFTLRDEEYRDLSRLSRYKDIPRFPLNRAALPASKILKARLRAWAVPYSEAEISQIESEIADQSGGLPVYLELLASEIAKDKKGRCFNRERLLTFPRGMVDLIWQIIQKNCEPIKCTIEEPTLSIVKLLSTGHRLSEYFLEEALQILCPRRIHEARIQRDHICAYHEVTPSPVPELKYYELSSHWEYALGEAVKNPGALKYGDAVSRYRSIDVDKVKQTICDELSKKLRGTSRDALLTADLVRIGESNAAERATRAWFMSSRPKVLRNPSRSQAEIVLCSEWLATAGQETENTSARNAFEIALEMSEHFDNKCRLLVEMEGLHKYIRFLRKTVLIECPENEYDKHFAYVRRLYGRWIGLKQKSGKMWESMAHFYQEELHFREAVECCEKAKNGDASEIDILAIMATHARCLGRWAAFEWPVDQDRAEALFQRARSRYEEALIYAEKVEAERSKGSVTSDWSWQKQRLRQEYARGCLTEADTVFGRRRRELQQLAHSLLYESWKEDSHNSYTVFLYANSLLSRGDARTANGRQAIRDLVEGPINTARAEGPTPDPHLLRIHAKFVLACDPPDFAQAELDLEEALRASGSFGEKNLAWQQLVP